MRVREATPADADAVREVYAAFIAGLGPATYGDEQVEAWRRGVESADYTAAIRDDELAFGSLRHAAPEGYETAVDAEATAVYVHPDAARDGVGSAVLADRERRARDAGVESLGCTSSLNGVGFYERHGYERVRERSHEFSSAESTDVEGRVVEMAKVL